MPQVADNRRYDEAGAQTVEIVLGIGLFMTLVMVVMSFAIWGIAVHAAKAAAELCVEAAAPAQQGSAASGWQAANSFLGEEVGSLMSNTSVNVNVPPPPSNLNPNNVPTASCTVTGTINTLTLWFVHIPVHAASYGPEQIFVPQPNG